MTTCKRGHPLTPDSVVRDAQGWRRCRACQRAAEDARRDRIRKRRAEARLRSILLCAVCGKAFAYQSAGPKPPTCGERCQQQRNAMRREGIGVEDCGTEAEAASVEPARVPLSLTERWLTLAARL